MISFIELYYTLLTLFFLINFNYLLAIEKSKAEEDRRVEELKDKLEHAVATRQEAEAKLIQAETTIKEFMLNSSMENVSFIVIFSKNKKPSVFFKINLLIIILCK